jgi:hypothetical protein
LRAARLLGHALDHIPREAASKRRCDHGNISAAAPCDGIGEIGRSHRNTLSGHDLKARPGDRGRTATDRCGRRQ